MGEVVAAVDCGTNSTRLLVADLSDDGGETLRRRMAITRLGQDVDRTGALDPTAIERTLAVLREYRSDIDELGAARLRVTATSAARDADNRDELFGAVEGILGRPPELLSGEEEAALSFAGATRALDPDRGPYLVADIGGGSTEFALGAAELTGSISTDMGCVRMTEKYLDSDPPAPEELASCLSEIRIHLDDVTAAIPGVAGARRFVGLAGTVSTAAAVEQGLVHYDSERIHHFVLTREAVEDVFRTLATESLEDRRHNPGLEPDRAEVIVAGMCILVQIMRSFDFDDCLVSECDILDGLAWSLR